MDQVLFSEPSTKMKEKLAAMREAELANAPKEILVDTKEVQSEKKSENLSSEEEKFLKDKFGN